VARQKKEKFVDRMKERATDWREWATRRVKGLQRWLPTRGFQVALRQWLGSRCGPVTSERKSHRTENDGDNGRGWMDGGIREHEEER
jgi:hypothetical protein